MLFLPFVQEVTDVENDEALDVGLHLQLSLKAPQACNEHIRVALGQELREGILTARATARGLPTLCAEDAEIGRRALPHSTLFELAAQGRAQGHPNRFELP